MLPVVIIVSKPSTLMVIVYLCELLFYHSASAAHNQTIRVTYYYIPYLPGFSAFSGVVTNRVKIFDYYLVTRIFLIMRSVNKNVQI